MSTQDFRSGSPAPTGSGDQTGTADQAKQAAGTAVDEGKHVAETAKDQAAGVAADAKEQVRNLIGEARTQVEDQSRSQLENLVATLKTFADDLESMARGEGQGSGLAKDVVQQVGDKARGLSSQIQGREPAELLDQARDFARRRPGTFLLGAVAAGVVAGRLARGTKDAASAASAPADGTDAHGSTGAVPPPAAVEPTRPAGTAMADPLSGTVAPPPGPPAGPEATQGGGTQWGTP
ncbi:hypothetical protein JK386_17205 [Nocardioides sp. zg-536]|uniref:DUF3618 domain-containing protein n=1 Tax=Nocardioides faecalis TaxID=2803858 RepID=A0A938Y4B4_9ACTN|nr:hypothetical protein [Nocardioides faecalis]MBM9461641.1 hypothetical protein [Nocardioides faecalis]QVI57399.1 hypothetical protein KG111_09720 [Nocardioides faecalis]